MQAGKVSAETFRGAPVILLCFLASFACLYFPPDTSGLRRRSTSLFSSSPRRAGSSMPSEHLPRRHVPFALCVCIQYGNLDTTQYTRIHIHGDQAAGDRLLRDFVVVDHSHSWLEYCRLHRGESDCYYTYRGVRTVEFHFPIVVGANAPSYLRCLRRKKDRQEKTRFLEFLPPSVRPKGFYDYYYGKQEEVGKAASLSLCAVLPIPRLTGSVYTGGRGAVVCGQVGGPTEENVGGGIRSGSRRSLCGNASARGNTYPLFLDEMNQKGRCVDVKKICP